MLIASTRERDKSPLMCWFWRWDRRSGMLGIEERMERLCGSYTRSHIGCCCCWGLILEPGISEIREFAVDGEVDALSGFWRGPS